MNAYEYIDKYGTIKTDNPLFNDVLDEMARSHSICQKLNDKRPIDEDYKDLLKELFDNKIDDSVSIVSPFYCDVAKRLVLGKNITINYGVTIISTGLVIMEDNVLIAPNVRIATVNHDYNDRLNTYYFKKVVIKENAWICIGSIITPGVTIGKNAIVAAGSVVIEDVPDNVMVGGNPAKIIKYLHK